MRRSLPRTWIALALLFSAGCATGPLLENPLTIGGGGAPPLQEAEANPIYVPQGPIDYRQVFDHCRTVLTKFGFEIMEETMFEGRIETMPRTSPGVLLFLKPGNPDFYERLLATFQSYRHRAVVKIQPAGQTGGFFITLAVYKELEDLPRPTRSTSSAIFRVENNVARQYTVVDPTIYEAAWLPKGRDTEVEQILLRNLKAGF
jgi:hypothetical protein